MKKKRYKKDAKRCKKYARDHMQKKPKKNMQNKRQSTEKYAEEKPVKKNMHEEKINTWPTHFYEMLFS